MRFENTVTTLDELREVIAPPSKLVTAKEVTKFDDYCRDFIARSPFVLIASSDGQGSIDISPKGDPPGFVQVLDDTTLAIPDRPGNHRADTFLNVVRHPYVGVIFLIQARRTLSGCEAVPRSFATSRSGSRWRSMDGSQNWHSWWS